jgi:hypothetical protein
MKTKHNEIYFGGEWRELHDKELDLPLLFYYQGSQVIELNILQPVEPLLRSDLDTDNETTFAARQQIFKNRWPLLGNGSVNTFPWQRIRMQQ